MENLEFEFDKNVADAIAKSGFKYKIFGTKNESFYLGNYFFKFNLKA